MVLLNFVMTTFFLVTICLAQTGKAPINDRKNTVEKNAVKFDSILKALNKKSDLDQHKSITKLIKKALKIAQTDTLDPGVKRVDNVLLSFLKKTGVGSILNLSGSIEDIVDYYNSVRAYADAQRFSGEVIKLLQVPEWTSFLDYKSLATIVLVNAAVLDDKGESEKTIQLLEDTIKRILSFKLTSEMKIELLRLTVKLSELYRISGKYSKAEKLLLSYLASAPKNSELLVRAYFALINNYLFQTQFDQVSSTIKRAQKEISGVESKIMTWFEASELLVRALKSSDMSAKTEMTNLINDSRKIPSSRLGTYQLAFSRILSAVGAEKEALKQAKLALNSFKVHPNHSSENYFFWREVMVVAVMGRDKKLVDEMYSKISALTKNRDEGGVLQYEAGLWMQLYKKNRTAKEEAAIRSTMKYLSRIYGTSYLGLFRVRKYLERTKPK